ncbi:MAG TPA: bifunctional nuclease family protein [Capsulimonadaceae bacterium]
MSSDFKDLFGEDWQPHDIGNRDSGNAEESAPAPEPEAESGEFTSENENRTPRTLNEKEVKVMGVYMHQEPGLAPNHFVLLRDNRGRRVPIWVGQFEAFAISYAIEEQSADRPLTHDLMKIMLERLGGTVDRIIIDDLWRETFYAKITIVTADSQYIEIDARPSDAVALALRVHAPIYMAEYVLDQTVHKE